MPNRDGTGPNGRGPLTGRGKGPCNTDKRGRIMEGPRGGQWTSPRSHRPEVDALNCRVYRKKKKKK